MPESCSFKCLGRMLLGSKQSLGSPQASAAWALILERAPGLIKVSLQGLCVSSSSFFHTFSSHVASWLALGTGIIWM